MRHVTANMEVVQGDRRVHRFSEGSALLFMRFVSATIDSGLQFGEVRGPKYPTPLTEGLIPVPTYLERQ